MRIICRVLVQLSSDWQDRAPLEPDEWSTVKNKKQVKVPWPKPNLPNPDDLVMLGGTLENSRSWLACCLTC